MRALAAFAIALLGCASTPSRPTTSDYVPPDDGQHVDGDGLGTPVGDACHQLRKVGCPEGFPHPRTKRTCFQSYTHVSTALHLVVPVACLRDAVTSDDVRMCGDANTIRVRCVMPSVEELGSYAPQR